MSELVPTIPVEGEYVAGSAPMRCVGEYVRGSAPIGVASMGAAKDAPVLMMPSP